MEVIVNNETKTISSNSLLSLVDELMEGKTKGIAVAVNQTVIPKIFWASTFLKENDNVLIIKATQGG
jgi:sulfur carrier protein